MLAKDLTQETLRNLSIIERIGSALSLLGVLFIITTFFLSPTFHRPYSRMIFYASAGNVFTSVATMISRGAVNGSAVTHTNLCKTQAFLIQMFMPADALWAFCMAFNCYVTFYHGSTAANLRDNEKWYCLFCYGVTFVVAFALLWISTIEKGHMYGNATLWCWISSDWDHYRMYLFYGPIWFICILTILIYTRLCITTLRNKLRMHNASRPDADRAMFVAEPIVGTRTTNISVSSEPAPIPLQDMSSNNRAYKCDITGGGNNSAGPSNAESRVSTNENAFPDFPHQRRYPVLPPQVRDIANGTAPTPPAIQSVARAPSRRQRPHNNTSGAQQAWNIMATVSLFFFFIMMITWIPSSANRLYSVVNHGHVNLYLEYLAAIVLPLQGFWNCVIYTIISRDSVRELFRNIRDPRLWTIHNFRTNIHKAFVVQPPVVERPPHERNSRMFADNDSGTLVGNEYSRPGTSRPDPHTGRMEVDLLV